MPPLHTEIEHRFGVLPNFFRLAPETPEITASLWGFAKLAYLENPLPSLFKERLFVYLSRFCDSRYCVARHVGFLLGLGHPSGDAQCPVHTVDDTIRLLRRPLPRAKQIEPYVACLACDPALVELPERDSRMEEAIFACATHVFLQTAEAPQCLAALERALGASRFQHLLAFLAFVRTAHYWTKVHPALVFEEDVAQLLATHEQLAECVLHDPEAGTSEMSQTLTQELISLRETKQRYERTEEAQERLAAIVESSDDAIVSKTLDGVITSWNRGAERIFGYTAAEAIGQQIYLIIPEDRHTEERHVLARLRRGERIDHFDTERQTKDGRRVSISLTVSPVRNAAGRIIGASKVARDVTERKQFEQALRTGEERYRRIFETTPVSIWEQDCGRVRDAIDALRAAGVHDLQRYCTDHPEFVDWCRSQVTIVDVNEATLHMFRARDKQELLRSLEDIFTTQTREVFVGQLVAIAKGTATFEAETVLRTLRGDALTVLISVSFPPADQSFRSVLVCLSDITVRKHAERALREQEGLFHEMADTAPAMLWVTDQTGARTFISQRWYMSTGTTPGAALGFGWLDIVHPDDRRALHEIFAAARERRAPFQAEYRLKRAEGDYRWVLEAAEPRFDGGGQFLGYLGSVIDITERRVAEDALKEEARVRETLARTGASLAAELDADTLLQAVTDAGTALTAAEFGAFVHNVADASGPSYILHTLSGAPKEAVAGFLRPRATSLFDPTFRGEGPVRIDDVTKDARYAQSSPHRGVHPGHLPVRSYLAVPVTSRSGGVLGGLFFGHSRPGIFWGRHEELAMGIASWAALALDNARLYSEAQRANRLKDEFLATLSHELRTPLNVMLGWAHLLRSTVLPAETERRALESIERSAKAQARVVEDLLDVSRIVSGKLQMKSEEVGLASVVSGAVESVRPTAVAKGLDIQLRLARDTEIMVTGDADRLRQVVWNLLSNALKFTPKGGQVSIALRHTGSNAEIIVQDTGQGIPSDFLPHVFERFRQADTAVSRKHVGLGLGLTLVRLLAEAHGGSVTAASAGEGKGATFTVRLPVRAVRGHIPTIARGQPAAGAALTGLHALVVDDEPEARDVLQVLLQLQGADVTAAGSAGEALNMLAERRIDIVLADIGMPDEDGYALIQAIRALAPDQGGRVPAIAVTAYAAAQDRHRALDAGYGWHLAKPVDPEQLIAAVLAASKSHNIDA